MIDRVARVLGERIGGLGPYQETARAVIEAMREPTEPMWLSRPVDCPNREVWARWWNWQIDAMLNEDTI